MFNVRAGIECRMQYQGKKLRGEKTCNELTKLPFVPQSQDTLLHNIRKVLTASGSRRKTNRYFFKCVFFCLQKAFWAE